MGGESESAIRERAYRIWEAEGRPDGKAGDHWHQAMHEMFAATPVGSEAMPTLDAAEIVDEAPAAPKVGKARKAASETPPPVKPKAGRAKIQPNA